MVVAVALEGHGGSGGDARSGRRWSVNSAAKQEGAPCRMRQGELIGVDNTSRESSTTMKTDDERLRLHLVLSQNSAKLRRLKRRFLGASGEELREHAVMRLLGQEYHRSGGNAKREVVAGA